DSSSFRVVKLFLFFESPFFEALFVLPQPSGDSTDVEIEDGLFVFSFSEDSKELDALSRYCYPCILAERPALKDFGHIVKVLDAAKKHSLDAGREGRL
ncbi:hypothetical protein EDC04DRAFT_2496651, partial [Pisolithus marmoratus]